MNDTGKVFMVSPSGQATLVGAVPFNTITRLAVDTDLLTVGNNCLRVEVNNTGGGAGFALAGLLYVPRGRCPCDHAPIAPARRRT